MLGAKLAALFSPVPVPFLFLASRTGQQPGRCLRSFLVQRMRVGPQGNIAELGTDTTLFLFQGTKEGDDIRQLWVPVDALLSVPFHQCLVVFKIVDDPRPVIFPTFGQRHVCILIILILLILVRYVAMGSNGIVEELNDMVLRCSHTPELLHPRLVGRMLGVITDLLGESSLVAIARHEILQKLSGISALNRFRSNKTFPKTHRFLQVLPSVSVDWKYIATWLLSR